MIRELNSDELNREAPELAAWIRADDGEFSTAFSGPAGVFVVFETSGVFVLVVAMCTLRDGVVRSIQLSGGMTWTLDVARAVARQLAAGELIAHDLERSALVVTRGG